MEAVIRRSWAQVFISDHSDLIHGSPLLKSFFQSVSRSVGQSVSQSDNQADNILRCYASHLDILESSRTSLDVIVTSNTNYLHLRAFWRIYRSTALI